jgi:protoporphyrinogen oxidase
MPPFKLTYKFVIIGAGVSGLSTALELSKVHLGEILILEKDDCIGGLCKTINKNDAYYDLGAHTIRFQIPEKQLLYIDEITGSKSIQHNSGSMLRLKNSFISYPVKSLQFFLSLGIGESLMYAVSLIKNRLLALFKSEEKKNPDYETSLINKSGSRAYETLYGPFARKEWGCEPKTISTSVMRYRMSMNPSDAFNRLFKKDSANYYYMNQGIGDFAKGIGKKLSDNKVTIFTGIESFDLKNEKNIHQIQFCVADSVSKSKSHFLTITYEKLISTIPIEELVLKLDPGKAMVEVAKKVKWRGLKLVYIHIEEEPLLPGETFHFPEIDYIFNRVSIPKRFSNLMQPDQSYTSFVCEIPCSEGDEVWKMTPETLYAKCFKDLVKSNLIKGNKGMLIPKNFVIDLNKVYPLFTHDWQDNISQLLDYLQTNHKYIYTSGKGGFFIPSSMDHSIDMGLQLAQNITEGKNPENWYKAVMSN